MEAVECGAAALAIVLAHFGRWIPLETLRESVGVSRDGSNARSIARAARAEGLTVRAYRRSITSVRNLPLPLIVFWQMNHFLVLEGWREGRWYLNDPATGPRHVDDQEFSRSFSGIVLQCQPGPDFVPEGRRPMVWQALLRRLSPLRAAVLYIVLAGIALLVPGLAVPALSRAFVDGYLLGGRADYVPVILGGFAAAAAVQVLLGWLQANVVNGLRSVLTGSLFLSQTQRILRLPIRFFDQRAASDVAYRAGLGASVAGLLSGPLVQAFLQSTVAIIYLIVIAVLSWQLALIVFAAALIVLVFLRFTARHQQDLASRQMRDQIDTAVLQSSSLSLIESIKAQGGEAESMSAISASRARLLTVRQQQDVALLPLHAVPAAISGAATLSLLTAGALLVMNGRLELGALLAVQILMGSVLAPLGLLAGLGGQVQQLTSTLARLQDVDRSPADPDALSYAPPTRAGGALTSAVDAETEPLSIQPLRGHMELQNLSFGYSSLDEPLVDGFSLTMTPGSRVALVGFSGSGKSTVAKLVAGLYRPWSGVVLLDGRPRISIDRRVIADGLGFVDQTVSLFDATIRDNITLWDPAVADEQVVRAVRDAGLEEALLARPGGFESVLGEGGRGLSGGQRQRMEIARALVRDPAVLVLDEATSALDAVTEKSIDLALRRRGCTCLIVAHRLSTVRDADEILVLDRGRIVERGDHSRLLKLDGQYARLVKV